MTVINQQEISSESIEYVKCRVEAIKSGVAYNPTNDDVHFAFCLSDDAHSAVWKDGSWETIASEYYARCLVGPTPGLLELTAGETYHVFVKITDTTEIPVKHVGLLKVI
jgi:hypothetical protein